MILIGATRLVLQRLKKARLTKSLSVIRAIFHITRHLYLYFPHNYALRKKPISVTNSRKSLKAVKVGNSNTKFIQGLAI